MSRPHADPPITVEREGRGERGSHGDRPALSSGSEPSVRQVDATEPVSSVRQGGTGQAGNVDAFRRSSRETVDHNRAIGQRHDNNRDWHRDGDRRRDWSRDWRRDNRYDWSGYRNSHRSVFQLGRYYDPYGWGYRRFATGYSLRPYYYRSRYWLDDPWMYHLPPAYGPYRWVRYYDDALLVNIDTGFVVDVIHNFFW